MLEVPRVVSALVVAATIAACGASDSDSGTAPKPAISIALSSSALSITQGTTGTVTANLTRSGGFTGDVAITVEGLPGTVTYASGPATIGGSASAAVITFDVGESATPGVINATVIASGTGVSAVTAPLAITAVAAPTYTLAVANAAVTATQGGTATQTINITRTGGFVGAVALTAEGLPTGVTAAFDPQSATGNSSTLTLAAAPNAATGSATVTVKGTATGQADKTATFQLTVNAAPTYTLAVANGTVTATQGATATQTLNIVRTGGFAAAVALTAEGLASGVTASFDPQTAIGNASTLTLTAAANAATGSATVTVKGTATGQADKTATVQLTVNAAPTYTLGVANATVTETRGTTATQTVNITRTGGFAGAVAITAEGLPTGVTAAFDPQSASGNASTLTLTAASSAATGSATVTVKGTASGQADKATTFQLTVNAAPGDFRLAMNPATLTIEQGTSGTSTVKITRSGIIVVAVFLTATGLPNGVTAVFSANPAVSFSTLTLTASPTAATGPATVTIHARSTRGFVERTTTLALTVNPAAGDSGNASLVLSTLDQMLIWLAVQESYVEPAASYDFTVPDFGGVAGWDNNWGPKTGSETEWRVSSYSFTGIGLGSLHPVFKGAGRSGTIKP